MGHSEAEHSQKCAHNAPQHAVHEDRALLLNSPSLSRCKETQPVSTLAAATPDVLPNTTAAAGPLMTQSQPWLSSPAAGHSAAASPGTPSAAEVPLSSITPPTPQQQSAPTPAAATRSAAAAAVACSRHLEGSLLLHQLLPLTASLDVALMTGDVRRMHTVLTLLQSVPLTGQLLFASQVARHVRGILQQQVQLQSQHMQEQEVQQLLQEVMATARQLLQRWKALLAAEVSATDTSRRARAKQLVRSNKLKADANRRLQHLSKGPSITAGSAGCSNQQQQQSSHVGVNKPPLVSVQQHSSRHPPNAAGSQPKRSYGEWLLQQHHQQLQQQQGPANPRSCTTPSQKKHKQAEFDKPQHSGQARHAVGLGSAAAGAGAAGGALGSTAGANRAHMHVSRRADGAAGAAGGGPVTAAGAVSCAGPTLRHVSSGLSLGAPVSSTDDLVALGLGWDEGLPSDGGVFTGGAGSAVVDMPLAPTSAFAGPAAAEGLWAGPPGGDDDAALLLPDSLQGQGQEASAYVLGRLMTA